MIRQVVPRSDSAARAAVRTGCLGWRKLNLGHGQASWVRARVGCVMQIRLEMGAGGPTIARPSGSLIDLRGC